MKSVRTYDPPVAEGLLTQWVTLPATPAAAGLARRFLDGLLAAERADVVDTAALLASELVANAVLHGQAPIRLQLRRDADVLRVEVGDGGPPFSVPPAEAWSLTGEGGRGLLLLDALARSWGSDSSTEAAAGKTLWFELTCGEPDEAV